MSNQIRAPKRWAPYDPDGDCRNWYQDDDGNQYRMPNHVEAMEALRAGCNHVLAHCPRVTFTNTVTVDQLKDGSYASSEPSEGAPLWEWKLLDKVPNGRARVFSALVLVRGTDPGASTESYFVRTDNSSAVASPEGPRSTVAIGTEPVLISEETGVFVRGAAAGAVQSEGIGTFNGHRILDLVVQDEDLEFLDTTDHDVVTSAPGKGAPVVSDSVEAIRDKFHAMRTTNLPLLGSWAAGAVSGTYSTTATTPALSAGYGSHYGIAITSTSLVNVFDQSITAYAATSPGMRAHVQHCGIGDQSVNDNCKKLKAQVYVLARAVTATATIQAEGSNTFASNTTNNTLAAGASPSWVDVGTVYLDTSIANNASSINSPKIDVFGKAGASGTLYIYGITAYAVYGL